MITDVTGSAPVLLLDDVFSELDPDRSDALLANLPPGQTAADQRQRPAPEGRRPTSSLRHIAATARIDAGSARLSQAAAWRRVGAVGDDRLRMAAAARPLPVTGRGPQPLGRGSLDAVMRGLGAPEASGVHLVFDRWAEVVGEALAARTRPLRIDGKRLVLAVDEPAIATHVRFLQTELLARLAELLGPDRVTSLDLRVGPKS